MRLPKSLVDRALHVARGQGKAAFDESVREALTLYVARGEEAAFAEEMASMARDPRIRAENRAIDQEFEPMLWDGLG